MITVREKLITLKDNKVIGNFIPLVMLLIICVFFSVLTSGRFASARNLKIVFDQAIVVAVVATGGVFIYSSGNMNVAMGGSTAIGCVLGARAYLLTGSPLVMILVCVLTGLLIMGICCVLCQILKISIVVITMILMTLLTGLQEWLVGSTSIQLPYEGMSVLQQNNVPLLLLLGFFLVCLFLFEFTNLGKTLKFIGENNVCSNLTGIKEAKYVVIAFMIAGIAVGLGGAAFCIRSMTVTTTSCASLNMDVILAIVLAGTPMSGGSKSKVYSGALGAITAVALSNGLIMIGVDSIYVQAVKGLLFILILILSEKRSDVLPVKDMV